MASDRNFDTSTFLVRSILVSNKRFCRTEASALEGLIMAWHFEIKMSFQNKGTILAFKKKIKMPNILQGDVLGLAGYSQSCGTGELKRFS